VESDVEVEAVVVVVSEEDIAAVGAWTVAIFVCLLASKMDAKEAAAASLLRLLALFVQAYMCIVLNTFVPIHPLKDKKSSYVLGLLSLKILVQIRSLKVRKRIGSDLISRIIPLS
jgi:hypothetical protein